MAERLANKDVIARRIDRNGAVAADVDRNS